MTCQRGRDDQTIRGVGMEVGEPDSPNADVAVDGNFHHTLFKILAAPCVDVVGQPDSALADEHGHFPERNRGHGELVGFPCSFDVPACDGSEPVIATPQPQQDTGV